MLTKIKLGLLVIIYLSLTACASELNAPCDQYAHFCGSKTKINQW